MGRGVHSISELYVYFLVAICILAGPFLKMIDHGKLEKFADTNVCGGAFWVSKLVSKYVFFNRMKKYIEIIPNIGRFGFNTIWANGFSSYSRNIYLICFLISWSTGMFIVILLQNDVGKLLLILSCVNRKFDNLILSANFKISHLLYNQGCHIGWIGWIGWKKYSFFIVLAGMAGKLTSLVTMWICFFNVCYQYH